MLQSQIKTTTQSRTRSLRGRLNLRAAVPYLYLAPALIVIAVFIFAPLVQSVQISFYQWNLLAPKQTYVGLDNYTALFTDEHFYTVLLQSAAYLFLALLGNFLLPIGLALLTLRLRQRTVGFFQSTLFLPTVVAVNIAVITWRWFYLPTGGLFNSLLGAVGLPAIGFLRDSSYALVAVSIVSNWKMLGFHFLIALAGLRAIPKDYLEAAAVDGAEGFALIRRVILPLFSPTAIFLLVITLIRALDDTFVPIEAMTRGGPSGATENLMYSIFLEGFKFFRAGRASALSIVLIILYSGLIYMQFRLFERSVSYDR